MTPTSRPTHPDTATLRHFVLGQLSDETMDQVERHISKCSICARIAEAMPGDRLFDLLRRQSPMAVEARLSPTSQAECGTQGTGESPLRNLTEDPK
jgi:hypothetical protein